MFFLTMIIRNEQGEIIDYSDDWQAVRRMTAKIELEKALKHLSKRQRQSIELRLQGYKYKEIANLMGVSVGTIGQHISRAKMSIKRALTR